MISSLKCSAALVSLVNAFSCLDESGNFADYWAALKANAGTEMYYHDADTGSKFASAKSMGGTDGAVVNTINQLYGSLGKSFAYAMYNDEIPGGSTSSTRAHSKGVILFNGDQGFWLVHSFPKWPSAVEDGYKGLPSETYGQSFFCVSFRLSQLEKIATVHLLQWPQVYSSGISDDLKDSLPNFVSWIGGGKTSGKGLSTPLSSYNGRSFTHYGKSKECDCNLWEGVVAPGIGDGLLVETWQNGKSSLKMPSFCPPDYAFAVTNVTKVQMPDGRSWLETQDHAKWGISLSSSKAMTCIGDINRQSSQVNRGGGTLCYHNTDLWKAMSSSVAEAFHCDSQQSAANSSDVLPFLV